MLPRKEIKNPSLKILFKALNINNELPDVTINNYTGYYLLKIKIPEHLIESLKFEINKNHILISKNYLNKKIEFPEPADTSNIETEYIDGYYSLKIKKQNMMPEDMLNKWILSMGL